MKKSFFNSKSYIIKSRIEEKPGKGKKIERKKLLSDAVLVLLESLLLASLFLNDIES